MRFGRSAALTLALVLVCAPGARADDPPPAPEAGWLDRLLDGARQLLPGAGAPAADPEEVSRVFDAFLTFVVKHAAQEVVDLGLREDFLAALLDGRHDALALVAGEIGLDADALRELLASSWPRLQPLLQQLIAELGDERGATYRGLIDAARVLLPEGEVEWEPLGRLVLSPEALRELALLIAPDPDVDPLAFDPALDPELRALFGFGAPLDAPLPNPLLDPETPLLPPPLARRPDPGPLRLAWYAVLPAPVEHGPLDELSALARRLNGWVPSRADLDDYLPVTGRLLELSARGTLASRALEPQFHDLYRDLVLATAWKESCWRQFVRRKGKLVTIDSGIGAVGIMQINVRVWRGFYDADGLHRDAGYNARAGSEILHHYLRDYAIRKGEHEATGSADSLARAAYAIYNGGPAHMRRYRNPTARRSLRAIDQSFWEKYQAVKAGNAEDVARCYGEGG